MANPRTIARIEAIIFAHGGRSPPDRRRCGARLPGGALRAGLDGEAFWDNVDTGAAPGEALEFGRRITPRPPDWSNWDLTMYL